VAARDPYYGEIDELKWEFAAVLRRLREKTFAKQTDFAGHANLSEKTVSKLECGGSEPRLSTILILIDKLNVTPAELIGGLTIPEKRKPPPHHK
jgi:transcriptional regulator with XRE-family HTH domain